MSFRQSLGLRAGGEDTGLHLLSFTDEETEALTRDASGLQRAVLKSASPCIAASGSLGPAGVPCRGWRCQWEPSAQSSSSQATAGQAGPYLQPHVCGAERTLPQGKVLWAHVPAHQHRSPHLLEAALWSPVSEHLLLGPLEPYPAPVQGPRSPGPQPLSPLLPQNQESWPPDVSLLEVLYPRLPET